MKKPQSKGPPSELSCKPKMSLPCSEVFFQNESLVGLKCKLFFFKSSIIDTWKERIFFNLKLKKTAASWAHLRSSDGLLQLIWLHVSVSPAPRHTRGDKGPTAVSPKNVEFEHTAKTRLSATHAAVVMVICATQLHFNSSFVEKQRRAYITHRHSFCLNFFDQVSCELNNYLINK